MAQNPAIATFQFLIGRLSTHYSFIEPPYQYKFQFLIGRLSTYGIVMGGAGKTNSFNSL